MTETVPPQSSSAAIRKAEAAAAPPLALEDEAVKPRKILSDEHLGVAIGALLKSLRAEAKLSLDQLSRRSGVSRGMLSQIELGRSVPTITVLTRIATAFELPAAAFLSVERRPERVKLLKKSAAHTLRSPDGKFASRALFPFSGSRRVEFYELTLGAGCRYASDAHPAGTIENLVVTRGSVQVEIAGEAHELSTGDALYFAGDLPHTYRNRGRAVAIGYLVMTYLQPVSY